jgi:hypothetical protein
LKKKRKLNFLKLFLIIIFIYNKRNKSLDEKEREIEKHAEQVCLYFFHSILKREIKFLMRKNKT